jgi:hypothetical protein
MDGVTKDAQRLGVRIEGSRAWTEMVGGNYSQAGQDSAWVAGPGWVDGNKDVKKNNKSFSFYCAPLCLKCFLAKIQNKCHFPSKTQLEKTAIAFSWFDL